MKKAVTYMRTVATKTLQGKLDLTDLALPPFERWLPAIAVFLTGFVLAAVVGWAVAYMLMPKPRKILQTDASGAVNRAAGDVQPLAPPDVGEFNPIIARNLFNSESSDEDTTDQGCEPQPSTLPLKLRGVIFGGAANASLVLLESTATRETDSFILGESVPGSAKISDISKDRVYFMKNGCPQYLEVEQPEPLKRREADPSRRTQTLAPVAAGTGTDFSEEGFERKGTEINVTKQWIERAITLDFAKTLQDAKASPNMVGGQVKGFVLTQIRPDSVYEKMGFENGDVVRSINGIELNDAARAIQTLNAMRNEAQLEVTYERAGAVQTRKIQVK